jgi:hypothetical protein
MFITCIVNDLQILTVGGGAVGLGTALQLGRSRARFPMVSLEFFIDIILPAALWPWGRLSLLTGIFPGCKCGRCVGLTTLAPSCAYLSWNLGASTLLEPSGPVQGCNGIAFLFTVLLCISLFSSYMFRLNRHHQGADTILLKLTAIK